MKKQSRTRHAVPNIELDYNCIRRHHYEIDSFEEFIPRYEISVACYMDIESSNFKVTKEERCLQTTNWALKSKFWIKTEKKPDFFKKKRAEKSETIKLKNFHFWVYRLKKEFRLKSSIFLNAKIFL